MTRKIVLLEMNEVPDRILDGYVERHPQSKLAHRLPRCRRYSTHASDTCALSPWITWPTLHRGVNNEKHGILHFGQDLSTADEAYPPIWQILSRAGISTGVFGPLHSSPLPEDASRYAFFLPDTFAHTADAHPSALESFQAFNLAMARQSTRNVSRSVDLPSLARFLLRAPSLGLRPGTLASIIRQLLDERRESWKSTRRRTYQPVIAFDLFMKQLDRTRPDFSTFFTNHVASAMHRYWAALHPEEFEALDLGEEWQDRFRGEIDFAMYWADRFFACLVDFVDRHPEYVLMVASSMGQEAAHGERIETQLYLRKPGRLLERAGFGEGDWEQRPAMDPTVSLYVPEERRAALEDFLDSITIAGKPIEYSTENKGFFDLVFGQPDLDPAKDKLLIDGEEFPYEDLGFELTMIEDEAGSTGYHQPRGILLVYDPRDTASHPHQGTIETIDVAPALLQHFRLEVPDYMTGKGRFQIVD